MGSTKGHSLFFILRIVVDAFFQSLFVLWILLLLYRSLEPEAFLDPYFIPARSFLTQDPAIALLFFMLIFLWIFRSVLSIRERNER